MNETEVKKCPKCGNVMEGGDYISSPPFFGRLVRNHLRKGEYYEDKIVAFYCDNCGYIELYNEKKVKNKP